MTSGSAALWDFDDSDEIVDEFFDVSFPRFFMEPGDPILEDRIVGIETNDAAILEFDVSCLHGQLELIYQFGSEEYDEFVSEVVSTYCYNDAFMISIDDVVVSLTPDCLEIVAVPSIHPFVDEFTSCSNVAVPALRRHLYRDDEDDIAGDVTGPSQVEYDGMTVRLRIHAFVTPGPAHPHRLRIAIADVDDDFLDAALFIKEGSIRTLPPAP
jgi:hypothetical protein